MLLDISLNVYKSFVEVYKTGSISKASKRLFISQPAVSINIKTLENQMGCMLFTKSGGVLKPTPQAHILFKHVINSFNELMNAEQEIFDNFNQSKGIIKLGCQTHIFTAILCKMIAKFNKKYPFILFELSSRSTADMIKQLNNCDLDIILDTSPIDRPSDNIIITPFKKVNNVFCAKTNSGYPDIIDVHDLTRYPLIMPLLNSKTVDALRAKIGQVDFNPIFTSTTSESIVGLAKQGMGIGYVMENYVEDDFKNNTLKRIVIKNKELPTTEINVCYNKNNFNDINKLFIDFLTS